MSAFGERSTLALTGMCGGAARGSGPSESPFGGLPLFPTVRACPGSSPTPDVPLPSVGSPISA
eukprot:3284067-Alexandrium_andersonii.AAC.1